MAKKHHFLTLQRKTERNNFVQFDSGTGVLKSFLKDEVDAANDKFDYKPEAYQAAVGLVHKF